jgi:hypothetical protein
MDLMEDEISSSFLTPWIGCISTAVKSNMVVQVPGESVQKASEDRFAGRAWIIYFLFIFFFINSVICFRFDAHIKSTDWPVN